MAAMPNPAVWSPRRVEDLSFFRALVPRNFPLSEGGRRRFKLRARSSVNVNGRPSRMVPVEEAMSVRKNSKTNTNGSAANGSNWALAPRKMVRRFENRSILPPIDVKELPLDEGFSWSKENYNRLERTLDVWTFVLSLRVRTYLDEAKWSYIGGFTEEKQKTRRRKTASWLRECILQLGPTYIKIGQVSSTRSDLFPKEFVEELAKLQDRVPALSSVKAKGLMEKELGAPVNMIFREFEDQPISAASLGQVHRAVLQNGELVVVKVQRPGLKKLFDIDFENLKLIAEFFQNSESFGGPTRDWIGVYEECRTILYREIDYINEGRNADRFRRDFRNIKWVRVPAIYWDYTTVKVLTMEYVPGIKINNVDLLDAGNYDRSLIARRSIESYLIQILKNEFFHADPHPGNIAIDVDGSLIYYDFGMMGEIKSFTRDRLLQMFYAVYEKDAKKVVESLIELGALQPTGDMGSVRRSVQFFLNNLLTQIPNQEATLSAVGEDLFSIAVDQPFRFPATFTFVIRAFITLEGTGYILDPNFSFAKIAAPYAQELLDMRNSKSNGTHLVEEIQRQANDVRDATVSMPYRIQRIDEFIQQLERGDLKLRVRVFEAERAARKASVMQMATIYTVLGGTLLNTGAMLSSQGMQNFAIVSYVGAGLFTILVVRAMKRVQILDKFEKMI
uniref:ABC1 atypical kinase-like domain-containing protein n=1 Tax=Araucaria cunninghamii TaxID=56994 RepID=A0A0D6QWG2_ARACU